MTNSTESQTNSPDRNRVVKYLDRMGRLKQWSGIMANQAIQDTHQEQMLNRKAESAWTRKALWDSDESETDEMGNQQTILGDVTNPTPIVVSGSQSSSLGPLLAALLGAAIPGAGLVGYLLSQSPAPIVQPANSDETVEIGLGRIEDYFKETSP